MYNKLKWKLLSHVWPFVTPRTEVHQAPLSMGFPRQEHWSGFPFPSPGDFPNPGIKPALAGGYFTTESPGKPPVWSHFITIPPLNLEKTDIILLAFWFSVVSDVTVFVQVSFIPHSEGRSRCQRNLASRSGEKSPGSLSRWHKPLILNPLGTVPIWAGGTLRNLPPSSPKHTLHHWPWVETVKF